MTTPPRHRDVGDFADPANSANNAWLPSVSRMTTGSLGTKATALQRHRPAVRFGLFRCGKAAQMFQSFRRRRATRRSAASAWRLREWLAANGLDGFIVPRADEHQGEYVAAGSERLKWLTGFSGSAGVAIVLADRAIIFVDGRYTLQVRDQVDLARLHDREPDRQPAAGVDQGQSRQGRADRLRSVAAHDRRRQGADGGRGKVRRELVPLDRNPIDELVARPAEAAARAGRDPSDRLCRRTGQGQAGAARRRDRQGRRHPCGADRPVVDRLDLQHPRRRRAAHAAGAGLRRARRRRAAPALHRQAQAADHGPRPI